MKVIDATNMIAGRMANKVAKLALEGEEIAIVNCEKAIISGAQEMILARYKTREGRVQPFKGPFRKRMPDRILKSIIRGMLPRGHWSEGSRGRMAFSRIKCYIGVPFEFKDKKFETIPGAEASGLKTQNYLTIGELSKLLKGHG
ncbi:MAG: 50S ribosomal protein L13 [Candidatus Nanoarchaeia archaeon]